jgi:hypothetical protein
MKYLLCLMMILISHFVRADDNAHIEHVIKAQWETPDKPVNVEPVVIEGNYAVAGWAQGARGGRALLRRSHHDWEVFMCGGDDLTKSTVLQQSGLSPEEANELARKLKQAEQGLSSDTRKQLSIFEGVVPVDSQSHHHH